MKKFILGLLMLPVAAIASPKVGDSAVYVGSLLVNGQSAPVTLTRTLKAINGDTATIEEKFEGAGQVEVTNSDEKLEDILDEETGAQAVANCAAFGGTNVTLSIAYGTVNACKVMISEGAALYIAPVLFGFAKLENAEFEGAEGAIVNLELKSFTKGQ